LLTGLALAGAAMIHHTAQAAPAAMAVELEASWEMGEAVNATTMFDSGPNGLTRR
jgi:hypothetical protein